MSNDQIQEDYVLVPRKRTRLSGTRKMILGVMAIGAVAAIGGAGTFASFSASTTNDATFSTEKLILGNKVGGGTECKSTSGTGATIDNSGGNTNDGTCDSVFSTPPVPGTVATRVVELINRGDVAHDFYVWNTATCANEAANATFAQGTISLCTQSRVAIRQVTDATAATTVGTNCIYPSAVACSSTPNLAAASFDTGSDVATLPTTFATKTKVTPSTTIAAGSSAFYEISVLVRNMSTCGNATYTYDSAGVDATPNGKFSSAGVSCNNPLINKKAQLKFHWYMSS